MLNQYAYFQISNREEATHIISRGLVYLIEKDKKYDEFIRFLKFIRNCEEDEIEDYNLEKKYYE